MAGLQLSPCYILAEKKKKKFAQEAGYRDLVGTHELVFSVGWGPHGSVRRRRQEGVKCLWPEGKCRSCPCSQESFCNFTRHWLKTRKQLWEQRWEARPLPSQLNALCPELKGHVCALPLLQGILNPGHGRGTGLSWRYSLGLLLLVSWQICKELTWKAVGLHPKFIKIKQTFWTNSFLCLILKIQPKLCYFPF